MPVLETLDAAAVRLWARTGLTGLGRAREEIDALNVFPVPDGDTGTNLYLTLEAANDELGDDSVEGEELQRTTRALAHGALMGARGNSGVILSEILRGMGEVLSHGGSRAADAATLRRALANAADAAYASVARPVEGTMLTVARAAADGASIDDGAAPADLADVVRRAAAAAREALARTPDQLEALRRAGVVDAGGRGLVVLLDALAAVVTGVSPVEDTRTTPSPMVSTQPTDAEPGGPAFEVMYLLDAEDAAVPTLRDELADLGDSLLVVGGDGLWNVHVHVDDAGAAVEAGVRAGRPHRIKVTHFGDQVARLHEAGADVQQRTVVAVAAGDGLATLFESSGATVVRGGPGNRPSTRDLLAQLPEHGAEVVFLPESKDTVPVAEAAAEKVRAQGRRAAVVPTLATVQVLAALAVHDAHRRFDDDVVAMTAAARATRHGGVTTAVREALTMAGVCRPGDVLGVLEGDIQLIGADVVEVGAQVLDRLLATGGELVTIVTGEGATSELVDALTRHVESQHAEADVVVYDGGQQHYPVLVGVE